jgi:hypothetical protein
MAGALVMSCSVVREGQLAMLLRLARIRPRPTFLLREHAHRRYLLG